MHRASLPRSHGLCLGSEAFQLDADSHARVLRLLCILLRSAHPLCQSVVSYTHKEAAVSEAYSVSASSVLRMDGCSFTERVLVSDSGSVVVKLRLARLFRLRI